MLCNENMIMIAINCIIACHELIDPFVQFESVVRLYLCGEYIIIRDWLSAVSRCEIFYSSVLCMDTTEYDRVGLAQSVACPPLPQLLVSSPLGRVIPKTIIKMVQTASLHRHACVRVGVWQCSPTV